MLRKIVGLSRAAVNTAPFNIPLPSSIRAVRPDEGPPQAAAMGDISPTTSDPNPAEPDAALPLPTLEAEPSTRAELGNIASEISAAPVVNLEPPFPADQPPPHDAALPAPPLGPEGYGPGDLMLADTPVAATPVVAVPRSDVAAPADLPSGAASDSMPSGVPDDLTIIEGIGPKLAEVLRTAGITSFRQLAATTPEYLQQIITQAGIRIGDPTTWPEQAALAASDNLQALRELQDTLKGGRRV